MKVLWLGRKPEFQSSTAMFDLRVALNKITNVKFVSCLEPSNSKEKYFRKIYRIPFLVDKLNVDVVVIGPFTIDYLSWKELDKVAIPKAIICSDPQVAIPYHAHLVESGKIDLVLLVYNNWVDIYRQKLTCKIEWLPWCLKDRYNPKIEKSIDLIYAPQNTVLYPLRLIFWEFRDRLDNYFNAKPVGGENCRFPTKEYLNYINKSRIYAFDNSYWQFGLIKWIETSMMNTLIMSDGDQLGFQDKDSYVKVDKDNWHKLMRYYIKYKREAERIANKGREMFLKHHTSDMRAKQLLKMLKELS